MASEEKPLLNLEAVSFSYPGKPQKVLDDISLTLLPGDALLLTGPTGCGKSTLLKTMNGIIPLESSGTMQGTVRLRGVPTRDSSLAELAPKAGLVFQSPDDQLFCDSIRDEVAFGPQMQGFAENEVEYRVAEALEQVGLADRADGHSSRLSGGQKQRLAIASQLAMRPLLLALDEPVSQLDPKGCHEVMSVLAGLREKGMAIVLVEHRLTEALKLATRVAIMDQGKILVQCPAKDLGLHTGLLGRLGLKVPDQLLEAEIQKRLPGISITMAAPQSGPAGNAGDGGGELIGLDEVSYTYPHADTPALDCVSLSIRKDETLAIMGTNGSGKSTLLGLLSGQLKPTFGRLFKPGFQPKGNGNNKDGLKIAQLLQNPDLLLIESTLERQLSPPPGLRRHQKSREPGNVLELARRMGLEHWLASPPWALSKGQRLRAALGSLLSINPDLLLLDEPTTGQNQENIHRLLVEVLRQADLKAVVICSHDLETVCRFAQRVAVLDQGRLVELGPVHDVIPRLACSTDFCPEPPLALKLSRRLNLDPPLLTMESIGEFLDGATGGSHA